MLDSSYLSTSSVASSRRVLALVVGAYEACIQAISKCSVINTPSALYVPQCRLVAETRSTYEVLRTSKSCMILLSFTSELGVADAGLGPNHAEPTVAELMHCNDQP